ncbi:MAG: helix-turn-helix domain-containing protein [Lachnospiraceae bacterium]|nr:helix-turn-helix domain-containing protein [Lachnospiraceae bacterium]
MISNQILQNTIDGLKNIARLDFAVMDTDGNEVASTGAQADASVAAAIEDFVKSPADSQEFPEYLFFKIYDEQTPEYVLVVHSSGEVGYTIGKMAAFQLQGLMVAYKERFDKDNFIKNLLLDNLLLVDIYSRAKKLRVEMEAKRVVVIVEPLTGKENGLLEMVRGYVGTSGKDFVSAVDENSVVIVKELTDSNSKNEIERLASGLREVLEKEGLSEVHVAYGNPVGEIKEVSRSYKEAKMAMDVGKIFFEGRSIIAYSELGIGRLIYQLPIPLCKMFITEIFGGKNPEDLDEETVTTIHKFFENSLNVSETSRQLFIHRNTLVYRLDKLQKSTGLDLRVFEDAITFKIAMMVVRYMKYMEDFDY